MYKPTERTSRGQRLTYPPKILNKCVLCGIFCKKIWIPKDQILYNGGFCGRYTPKHTFINTEWICYNPKHTKKLLGSLEGL